MRVQRFVELLSRTEHEVGARFGGVLEKQGCSVERWRVLALLADRSGHAMSEIARVVMLPAPSLTRLIDGMVADNLVHRRVDPGDRRRVLVYATRRGLALHARLSECIERERDFIVDRCEEREIAALGDALGRFLERRP